MDDIEVKNRARTIAFTGELIAEAKSVPKKVGSSSLGELGERWTETRIYRTSGGNYVVAGVGKSTVPGETDRPWAHVSESAEGVVESLHAVDADGVRYLTHVNTDALEQAGAVDPDIRAAFMHERIE